jgi:hypothetical protein
MTARTTANTSTRRPVHRVNLRMAGWLRRNSERYLLEAAQGELARQVGRSPPVRVTGPAALFWRRVFVPVYRRLPWSVRRRVMSRMPGSHRRAWRPAPDRRDPAV